MERHDPEHMDQHDLSDTIRLDDIIREFSGGGKPRPQVSDDTVAFRPVQTPKTAPQTASVPQETISFTPVEAPVRIFTGKKKNKTTSGPQTVIFGDTQPLPSLAQIEQQAAGVVAPIRVAVENKLPTPQKLLQKYRMGLPNQKLRLLALGGLTVLSLLLLLWQGSMSADLSLAGSVGTWLSFLLLCLSVAMTPEGFIRGTMDLVHLRISPHTLTSLMVVLTAIHGLLAAIGGRMSYCPVAVLLLFFQYWSLVRGRSAMFYTLRTVCGFENPMGIFGTAQPREQAASLRRDRAKMKEYVQMLTQPAYPQRVLSIYSTVLLPLSAILALLMTVRVEADFLSIWMIILMCAMPCGAVYAYSYPFSYLAKRLAGFGGALCGWRSAELFGSHHTIILRDEDLFSEGDILSNGMKLFPGYEATRVTAYALAALELVESPLVPLFRALLPQTPPRYAVTEHRIYDNGGVGLAIGPDIVLVGSLSFVRSMGVHMPTGTRVRQAVYVSVNGELAAIFAIKYRPNSSTAAGLRDILANRNFFVVLAARDFLLTPELVAAKYELPTDGLQFPDYQERLRLSAMDSSKPADQGALIGRDTFGAFGTTVAAGRTLRMTGYTALVLTMIAGCLGLLLCLLLLAWDALAVATPMHIAAFQLLWTVVTGVVTGILLRL